MCDYIGFVHEACKQLVADGKEFDMLQIRDKTRELTGTDIDVRFRPCKFEALTFFERGGFPNFVMTTKVIDLPPLNDTDPPPQASVFSFIPVTVLLDTIVPAPAADPNLN